MQIRFRKHWWLLCSLSRVLSNVNWESLATTGWRYRMWWEESHSHGWQRRNQQCTRRKSIDSNQGNDMFFLKREWLTSAPSPSLDLWFWQEIIRDVARAALGTMFLESSALATWVMPLCWCIACKAGFCAAEIPPWPLSWFYWIDVSKPCRVELIVVIFQHS